MFDENCPSEIMVTIATFNEPAKAKHLKGRLQQAGVKADVHNEGHLQQVAFMSKPQANAKVLVAEEDFEAANKLMLDWEASDPEVGSAIRCPQCKSPRIEYPQLTRKFLTPSLASILFALKIFSERILLPGLPLHLGQRWGSAPTTGGLGNVFVGTACRKLQIPSTKLQGSSKFQASTDGFARVCCYWCLGFLWSLVLGFWSSVGRVENLNQLRSAWTRFIF